MFQFSDAWALYLQWWGSGQRSSPGNWQHHVSFFYVFTKLSYVNVYPNLFYSFSSVWLWRKHSATKVDQSCNEYWTMEYVISNHILSFCVILRVELTIFSEIFWALNIPWDNSKYPSFSVAKATLQSPMSVCLSVCHQSLRIMYYC